MLVLSLDTTTRAGSVALWRDGRTLAERTGDESRTHGQRLPRELLGLLSARDLTLADVDLFAVAAGPGSFTGLRVGIATIQGLAFANRRQVVAVSTLEALGVAGARSFSDVPEALIAVWMDAQRQEVFSALYEVTPDRPAGLVNECVLTLVDAPAVAGPARTLDRWAPLLGTRQVGFIGDGAARYQQVIAERLRAEVVRTVGSPVLAGMIAEIAARRAAAGEATSPHAIKPIYVRRPDAELAREK